MVLRPNRNLPITLLVLVCAGCSWLLLLFAHKAYPLAHVDSMVYMTPAVNLATGGGLLNQIYDRAVLHDPLGLGRFLIYPPLFQQIISALMGKPTATYA